MGALVITHYQRMLNHIKPEFVHILVDGKIVADGGPELAKQLEAEGYEQVLESFGVAAPGATRRRRQQGTGRRTRLVPEGTDSMTDVSAVQRRPPS